MCYHSVHSACPCHSLYLQTIEIVYEKELSAKKKKHLQMAFKNKSRNRFNRPQIFYLTAFSKIVNSSIVNSIILGYCNKKYL